MSQHLSSTGCPLPEVMPRDPVPFFSHGNINFKAHDVGWIISGIFALIACISSIWLINKHLAFFYSPYQQRHIVRILFMVPIYAIASFLSYFYYKNALYFQLLRDCYEALVIASFFNLLLSYLSAPAPTADNPIPQPYATREERMAALQEVFRDVHLDKWMFPFGWVKWRPDGGGPGEGKAFLWLMRIGIGQYVIIRPLSTFISVLGEAMGMYCLASWSPKFFHLYTSVLISVSVSIAMYCVLQLYWPLHKELEPFKPVIKFLAVKSVVFLTFWQETFLGLLKTFGLIKNHEYWSGEEIVIGLAAVLSCFEMMVFGLVHIKAFTYLPYRALAEPITHPDHEKPSSTLMPTSFEDWTALEERAKRNEVQRRRLAKMKLLDDDGNLRTKADGTPILQQTRKWLALWKCVCITDIARELGQETAFVASHAMRRKAVVDREKDLELAFGKRRESRLRGAKARGIAKEQNEEKQYEIPNMWGARDGGGPAIGRDGQIIDSTNKRQILDVPPSPHWQPTARSDLCDEAPSVATLLLEKHSLLEQTPQISTPTPTLPGDLADRGWWRRRFWQRSSEGGGERRRPFDSLATRTDALAPEYPAPPAKQQPPIPSIASIMPTFDSQSIILPPPHRLGAAPLPLLPTSTHPYPRNGTSSSRASSQTSRPFSLPPPSETSSPFSDHASVFTGAAAGVRHPELRRFSVNVPSSRDNFTEYVAPSRTPRRHNGPINSAEMSLRMPVSESRGLPPGAAPASISPSNPFGDSGSTRGFLFDEY
ncbi:DUF300-domain-containing protein [Meredithblackwellia eburnea MCA 4105]